MSKAKTKALHHKAKGEKKLDVRSGLGKDVEGFKLNTRFYTGGRGSKTSVRHMGGGELGHSYYGKHMK